MKKLKDKAFFENINEFLCNYLPRIRAKSNLTIMSYKTTLNLLLTFLCSTYTIDIFTVETTMLTSENIVRFLEWLEFSRYNSVATINIRLSCIRTFIRYLAEQQGNRNLIPVLQKISDIRKRSTPKNQPHEFLTMDQVKLVLDSPGTDSRTGIRDRMIFIMLYDTGCRSEELLSMKLGDFAHSNKTDYVTITGKNKKTRNTPLSEKAKKELNSYIKKFHPDGNPGSYLFFTTRNGSRHKMSSDNLARIMLKYERLLLVEHPDLPHLHPHLWRHTRAQNLYDAGMPLEIVSAWLGHSQLESTLIYSSIGLERKRKALQNATQGEDSLLENGCPKYCDDENLIKQLYGLK